MQKEEISENTGQADESVASEANAGEPSSETESDVNAEISEVCEESSIQSEDIVDRDDSGNDQEPEIESGDESETELAAEENGADSEISTESVIEAVLFAADEPVTAKKLVEIIQAGGVKEVKKHIKELNAKYKVNHNAFRIENIAGGYQMLTQSKYNTWLSKLIKVRSETKLTPAAMETLAIIAYKQPIMRVEIENIRGVAAGEMVRQLIEKGVVKIVGRAEELGRPLLYGTTRKFLEVFGLSNLKDLPVIEEEKKKLVKKSASQPDDGGETDQSQGPDHPIEATDKTAESEHVESASDINNADGVRLESERINSETTDVDHQQFDAEDNKQDE